MAIASINPTTGELLQTFTPLTSVEITTCIDRAAEGFSSYRHSSFEQRTTWLNQAAQILLENRQTYAKIMTLEMGKTLLSAIAEVEKCAAVCRYYAENGADFLADQEIATDASRSLVCYQPLGIVLAVMPWNFPFWQVFRFAAPALMAGNVALLKHASSVPQSALAIAEILQAAGFPSHCFQTLLIDASQVSQVIDDLRVQAATLTGSEAAGQSLASRCGIQIKKTVLELGGSDPFIVCKSADIAKAASTAVTARLINNGQSCIAAKRFILDEAIADQFEQLFLQKFQALRIGDPMLPDTDIGPLASPQLVEEIDRQVQTAIAAGAKLLCGGSRLTPGNFYLPTILTQIPLHSPISQEEFFGPVAMLFRVPNLSAAIKLANDSPFGLAASAWTINLAEQAECIRDLESGAVFINGMVKSDPRLPFGGIKRSGYGRELGIPGIHEFVNIKSVWIE